MELVLEDGKYEWETDTKVIAAYTFHVNENLKKHNKVLSEFKLWGEARVRQLQGRGGNLC